MKQASVVFLSTLILSCSVIKNDKKEGTQASGNYEVIPSLQNRFLAGEDVVVKNSELYICATAGPDLSSSPDDCTLTLIENESVADTDGGFCSFTKDLALSEPHLLFRTTSRTTSKKLLNNALTTKLPDWPKGR